MRRITAVVVVGLAAVTASDIAHAQTSQVLGRAWEDVVSAPGVKLGEGTVLHPIVGAETGFVNNVFYEESGGRNAGVIRLIGEFNLATLPPERQGDTTRSASFSPWKGSIYDSYDGPYFRDSTPGDGENVGAPPKMEFRAGFRMFYEEFLSGATTVRDQRNVGLNGNAHLHLFPYETIAVTLDNDLTRAIRPTNFESSGDLDRWINNFRAAFRVQLGGRAIVPEFRFHNRVDYFESSNSQFANRIQNTIGAKVNWWLARFTNFYADASIGFFSGLGDNNIGGATFKNSSMPLRIRVGSNTALTEKFSVRGFIGFGKGFYSAGSEFMNVIGSVGGSYRINPFGTLSASYGYDFRDSLNANFYTEHRIEGKVTQQIRRFLLEAGGGVRFRHYDGVPMQLGGGTVRNDLIIVGNAVGKYLLRDWLAITASLQLATDQTNFRSNVGGATDDPSYSRIEIFGGATAAF